MKIIGLFVVLALTTELVRFVYRKIMTWKMMKSLSKAGMPVIDRMDGFQFEVYLQALFNELGYRSEVTSKGGDYGADVILHGKKKIVIQAKRYGMKNKVSGSMWSEVVGSPGTN